MLSGLILFPPGISATLALPKYAPWLMPPEGLWLCALQRDASLMKHSITPQLNSVTWMNAGAIGHRLLGHGSRKHQGQSNLLGR